LITVKVTPRLRVKGLPKDIENMLPVPLTIAGKEVQDEAKKLLSVQGPSAAPGAGWPAYFNRKLGSWVEASNVGSPPHRQTGELQDSIIVAIYKKTTANIVATAAYAKQLEYGEGKMRGPRPFMRPSLANKFNDGSILRAFRNFLGL